jgi:hypothetical protein
MSDLKFGEKNSFETLFDMGGGYVLDFSDRTFSEFFSDYKIDINDSRYRGMGNSKAKRLREFWKIEANDTVGKVMEGMVSYAESTGGDEKQVLRCEAIVDRLLGREAKKHVSDEEEFLSKEVTFNLDSLDLEHGLKEVVQQRLNEISLCFESGASLSTVFLCGSTLEGLLLNCASKNPKAFNEAKSSPKNTDGKAKQFNEWTLNDMINVAYECRFIKKDVKDFSHSLRNFRNYIHPYQQMVEAFFPDKYTANISWQVLRTALADFSNTRPK